METSTAILEALPLLIPIIGILSAPLMMYIWSRFTARKNEEVQKTLRALIESGQQLSPDVIERLTADEGKAQPADRRERDLRWGVILTAFGIGLALFGVFDGAFDRGFVTDEGVVIDRRLEEIMDVVAIASVFLLIGLARLALWKWAPTTKVEEAANRDSSGQA